MQYTYKVVKAKDLYPNIKTGYYIIIENNTDTLKEAFYFKNRKEAITFSGSLYLRYKSITQIYSK